MNTNLFGLLGEKLIHSYSPEIHNMIFKNLNINGSYSLINTKKNELKNTINTLKEKSFIGVNVTIPYKIESMKYLDHISKEAQKIGAVNTIYFSKDGILGYNTDYYGFLSLIEKNSINICGSKALILGTGGASKAVYHALIDEGINEVLFASRTKKNFKKNIISYDEIMFLKGYDIIINCTPVGMYPNVNFSPVDKAYLKNFNAAIDLVYNPHETLFIKYAKESNLKYANGLYMLISQAVKSQEIWNSIIIPAETSEIIYKKLLGVCNIPNK